MPLFLLSLFILFAGGFFSLLARRSERLSMTLGAASAAVGCALGLVPALHVLASGFGAIKNVIEAAEPVEIARAGAVLALRLPWSVPGGSFHIEIDPLSAFFLIPIFGLSALAAIYGAEYLGSWRGRRSVGPAWFFFNLLVIGMALVATSRNAVLFLIAWEVMSIASFFLVTSESDREDVRSAGWTYLVATHLGTALLFVMFLWLGSEAGSFEFERFRLIRDMGMFGPDTAASVIFVLALIGFGTKAGLMPLHVWLPEAHPAAPSHVSAVMSGVMIKTGIYGIARVMTWLAEDPPAWWGLLLIAAGLVSGVLGVAFALAQRDLKRLLAYSSVENIGIITMGLGLGLLGRSLNSPALAAFGFAGALLHVLNHAAFKGLLFLGAGSVAHAAHTRDIERLGGLLKRMPWTGAAFLAGATAICGLPPFNGFISEFLIFFGAFGSFARSAAPAVPLISIIAALALIGGLAAACFAKAFGIVFLGEPRGEQAAQARESGLLMRLPMAVLAVACLAIGLGAPRLIGIMAPVAAPLLGRSGDFATQAATRLSLSAMQKPLEMIVFGSFVFLVLVAFLAFLRSQLLAGRPMGETGTWDCGYARPTPRMQYTASSFAQPLTDLFRAILRPRTQMKPPRGLFPADASFESHAPDVCREGFFAPLFGFLARHLARLRRLQEGRVQVYILYIMLTLIVLLIWHLR